MKYDDIINLNRPESKYPKMSKEMRAAQFAPFAALTGYEEAVKEMARLTDNKCNLSDGMMEVIGSRLYYIKENIMNIREVKIKYFVKDKKKNGGKYLIKVGCIKKVDDIYNKLYFNDGDVILFEDIVDIEIEEN